jgi:hypothetical protein
VSKRAAGVAQRIFRLAAGGSGKASTMPTSALSSGSSLARRSASAASIVSAVGASPRSAASQPRAPTMRISAVLTSAGSSFSGADFDDVAAMPHLLL